MENMIMGFKLNTRTMILSDGDGAVEVGDGDDGECEVGDGEVGDDDGEAGDGIGDGDIGRETKCETMEMDMIYEPFESVDRGTVDADAEKCGAGDVDGDGEWERLLDDCTSNHDLASYGRRVLSRRTHNTLWISPVFETVRIAEMGIGMGMGMGMGMRMGIGMGMGMVTFHTSNTSSSSVRRSRWH